ncbi:hypothetical protein J2R98_001244 [Alkalibacillus filiformis]|uniref:Uncharacterized protein n=1 Tax=Alkalibacillus filiformis TaxID=200990 RepID=A0ABU0DTD0_9BACI|nr:hypothetical protein [Alkalibacillus filiformis]
MLDFLLGNMFLLFWIVFFVVIFIIFIKKG